MFKIITSLFAIYFMTVPAWAASSQYADSWKKSSLNYEGFHSRFLLKGSIYLVDSSGQKMISGTSEFVEWRPGSKSDTIDANWVVTADGFKTVALKIKMTLNKDNSVAYQIQQFEGSTEDELAMTPSGKVIQEDKQTLKNFNPISWVAETNNTHRVIVRLTPELENIHEAELIGKIPVGGDRDSFIVTDNQGYLWGESVRFGGIYSGMTSHRGSFVISFYPFKGAKEIGVAQGKTITLTANGDLKVKILSDTDLVPGERRAKVYGKFVLKAKSAKPQSVSSFGQMEVSGIPKALQ